MPFTANPSALWLGTIVIFSGLLAIFCVAPMLLVLVSFLGLAPFDFGMLVISVPVAGIAVPLAFIARTAARDLTLPRPVLAITEEGLLDRRVCGRPILWSEVAAATSILSGNGGVVLELKEPVATQLEPFRPGTFLFERPEPGIAHIPVRAMTASSRQIADLILKLAAMNGATTLESPSHPRAQRRSLF